jgi:hypothetical protein
MIERLATAMSPWTYSPRPFIQISARATFVFLTVMVPFAGALVGIYLFSLGFLRGFNNLYAIFSRYRLKGPEIPRGTIGQVPDSITFYYKNDQFKPENIRATDCQVKIELPVNFNTIDPQDTAQKLLIKDIVTNITAYLCLPDRAHLGRCSKKSYLIYKEHLEIAFSTAECAKNFKFSISEILFPNTIALDQYLLYFNLCKKFCGRPERPHETRYISHMGPNLIRYLIEQIGPFTFLSIPYIKDFRSEQPQSAIERSSNTLADFTEYASTDHLHTIKLRFKMKIGNTVVCQEIRQEGLRWITTSSGIFNTRTLIDKRHVDFFIALIKNPQGASLDMPVMDLPHEIRSPYQTPDNVIHIHAVLDPPLHPALGNLAGRV